MLAPFETQAGFALFKILKEGKLENAEGLWKEFQTPDSARKMVKLKAFDEFVNTGDALGAVNHIVDGKLPKELIVGLRGSDIAAMSLGLSHSLSCYKLKFSPDKVDTMIVQAIGLLDDLDKELNTYAMKICEWYGWHFPELAKIVQDNVQMRSLSSLWVVGQTQETLTSLIMVEEVELEMKEAAVISMGTEVSDEDMWNIKALGDQVITLSEYRAQLYEYLQSRMNAIAPNLTIVVGELVGARLIAHAGSLVTLAKYPASTVQILGAEKALFRALKTKQQTPKYGIIYHASLVGQAPPKFKGKIARALAPKSALSTRSDALGEYPEPIVGIEGWAKVEARLRQLEGRELGKSSGATHGKANVESTNQTDADSTLGALTENESWKTVEGKKKKKQNEVPVVEAAEVGNTLSKKKTREDKTSEAEPEVIACIAMTVDRVKAEEKLKDSLKKKTSASIAAEDVATADASPELKASIEKRKAEPVMEVPVDAPVDAVKTKKKKKSKAEA
ncbi:unnamed protein product [Sphagnum jensenii]|uniref:Nop domain-containing protein n=1 Tax=Sphagnum jensenii TaxID=128206 RepID=A0ABP1BHP3_9BRYO